MQTPPPPGPPSAPQPSPQPARPGQDLWGSPSTPDSAHAGQQSQTSAQHPPHQPPGWERDLLERLAFASLNEQRTARRWRILWRLALLGMLGLAMWMLTQDHTQPPITGPHTAVVTIQGTIAADTDASAEKVITAMRTATEAPGSKALVLLINSPGGSPVQAGMINDEITRLRKLHNKPIYAVVEETCASAAYYIAAAADQIYVDKASIVGSIGVLIDSFGLTGLMDLLGVERRLLTAGAHKGILDPFSPITEEQRQHIQHMLDNIHQQFITVVRQGRGTRLKETPDTFSGLMWTGEQAITQGLADQLGSLDSVARDIVQADDIIDYTQRGDMMERLTKQLGASVGESAMRLLQRQGPILH